MGAFDGEKRLQLASFHTVSKGFVGECGFRGGYCEFLGIPPDVQAQIIKLSSINLCSNTMGQVMVGLMSNPPKPGDPSHNSYVTERDTIKDSLKKRANNLSRALNELDGISCTEIEGAMYAFPSVHMPGENFVTMHSTCLLYHSLIFFLGFQIKLSRKLHLEALHPILCTA